MWAGSVGGVGCVRYASRAVLGGLAGDHPRWQCSHLHAANLHAGRLGHHAETSCSPASMQMTKNIVLSGLVLAPAAAHNSLIVLSGLLLAPAAAHNSLITPKPRNAIDSELPEWSGGKAPYVWLPGGGGRGPPGTPGSYYPCACRNGTEPCAVGMRLEIELGAIATRSCCAANVPCSILRSFSSTRSSQATAAPPSTRSRRSRSGCGAS